MSELDLTAAVDAGGRRLALSNLDGLPDWDDDLNDQTREFWRNEAATVLEAAAPLIEPQVRERVAREIEADMNHDANRNATLGTAARIARGGAR